MGMVLEMNTKKSNEVFHDSQLVYLWELNHPKDISESEVSERDVK